jgi:hypothetical protein
MVNMLDERDKLVEQLRDTQSRVDELQMRIRESERDKESLRRQIELHLQPVPLVGGRACGHVGMILFTYGSSMSPRAYFKMPTSPKLCCHIADV